MRGKLNCLKTDEPNDSGPDLSREEKSGNQSKWKIFGAVCTLSLLLKEGCSKKLFIFFSETKKSYIASPKWDFFKEIQSEKNVSQSKISLFWYRLHIIGIEQERRWFGMYWQIKQLLSQKNLLWILPKSGRIRQHKCGPCSVP